MTIQHILKVHRIGPACLDFAVTHVLTEPGFVHQAIAKHLKLQMLFIHAMV
ncbi:hypothetical protein [Desulfonatronum thiosulfatophilum]|uniref:hypothetical protein n=1 Tax=Desulfonatronum thiosulfatophilum TaxID=617002 RepID=UPI0012946DD2|nr:hypothetical protein [Desulfonatronum thiosulfatophilum]